MRLALFAVLVSFCSAYGQEVKSIVSISKKENYIHSIVKSPSGKHYAYSVGSSGTFILDSNFKEVKAFNYGAIFGGGGPSFSKNGTWMSYVQYGKKDSICVYNLLSDSLMKIECESSRCRFVSGTDSLLSGHWTGEVNLFHPKNNFKKKNVFKTNYKIGRFTISNDRKSFYMGSSKPTYNLLRFNAKSGKVKKLIKDTKGEPGSIKINKDDRFLAFTIRQDLYLYDLKKGKSKKIKLPIKDYDIREFQFSPDGKKLLIGGKSNILLVYRIKKKKFNQIKFPKGRFEYIFEIYTLPKQSGFLIGTENELLEVTLNKAL